MKPIQAEFNLKRIQQRVEGTSAYTITTKRAFERALKAIDHIQEYGTSGKRWDTLRKGLRILKRQAYQAHGASRLSKEETQIGELIQKIP